MNKEQYLKQSREIGLPSRCPILEYCSRHALTVYFYSDYKDINYENNYVKALHRENAIPADFEENQIKLVSEPPSWSKGKTNGMFTDMCPEVNLFDTNNGLPMARGLACTDGVWDIELKKPEQFKSLESKHYSECLEFSKHFYENKTDGKINKSTKPKKIYCYTYLMLDQKTGLHKIGISNNPNYREKTLRSEDPKIETILPGDHDVNWVDCAKALDDCGVRELCFTQANAQTKIAKELPPLPPERKIIF